MLNKIKINKILLYVVLVLAIVGFGVYSSFNVVPENNIGVLAQKDQVSMLTPGVHFVRPFANINLLPMDQQVKVVSGIANANGTLMNSFSIVWQVVDANKFWQVTHNDNAKITALFKSALSLATNTAAKNLISIQQNANITAAGVSVNQVLLTGQALDDDQLKATYQKMQGLATTIAQGIISNGSKNAQALRAEGDQSLIDIEGQAAAQAAQVIGEGQAQAIQLNAPLYHKNPGLFKLLVDTKVKMGM